MLQGQPKAVCFRKVVVRWKTLGVLTALALDKTGTLTEGKPKLTQVVVLGDISEDELLKIAVAIKALSDHPLANHHAQWERAIGWC